jgi:hypothetical protein
VAAGLLASGHLRADPAKPPPEPTVLVLVRSGLRPELQARVQSSADTWMTELGPGDHAFTFVADKGLAHLSAGRMEAYPLKAHVQFVDCPDSDVEAKLYTCVMTEALRVLLPLMHQHDAFVVVDDDAYLSLPNLKAALRAGEVGEAFGVLGCGVPAKKPLATGFCGGCGFGLTRAGALKLMEDPLDGDARYWDAGLKAASWEDSMGETATRFLLRVDHDQGTWADGYLNGLIGRATELKQKLRVTPPDDVLLGESMTRHGLDITNLPGLYGWAPKAGQYELSTCSPPPITFHRLSSDDKRRVHANIKRCTAHQESGAPCVHPDCQLLSGQ